jgi:tRNA pseudouridine65 synthase
MGRYLYPIHRLDRATSGVLLFSFDAETARKTAGLFRDRQVKKTYFSLVRGWTPPEGVIDSPLTEKESLTRYFTVGHTEIQQPVGRYATARYSLVRAEPETGRMHQIRRHFAHLSHPIIGDTIYGDGKHNRFFRDQFEIRNLFLKAYSLELTHPVTQANLVIRTRWNSMWLKAFELFGVCPIAPLLR